ncbi:unnamed protein product [Peronospora farinosa]|uniref:Uncharacterized protein n=1 Tax=Peronospora farinosa TaxID=134698 RepID=A0AAV0TY59_9STRA|nr:unnamed protein product [Peronospora farinosa]CAI5729425.1 unnamed protein product [Peronospora farinosa]
MLWHEEEKLEPMPPPPAPQASPDVRFVYAPQPNKAHNGSDDDEELLIPQSPPIPHTHPLLTLSDESARNLRLQQEKGGMAIYSSEKLRRHRSIATQKRLNATFLSRALEEPKENVNSVAAETRHSSCGLAVQLQLSKKDMKEMQVLTQLDEQERIVAATEASSKRHELLETVRQEVSASKWRNENGDTDRGLSNEARESALVRASERKVRKQLNAKWVQTREDPTNRPKGPLERPEERDLRETLFRTTPSDLIRSGVLYDEVDAARNVTFGPMSITHLPVISSGIVGLVGCCFEKYDHTN